MNKRFIYWLQQTKELYAKKSGIYSQHDITVKKSTKTGSPNTTSSDIWQVGALVLKSAMKLSKIKSAERVYWNYIVF